MHDLIEELNGRARLGAAYEAHQRHGFAIEPKADFFVAGLYGLAGGCGVRRLRRGQAHVHPANGTRPGSCEGSAARDRGRTSCGGYVGLAPRTGTRQQEAIAISAWGFDCEVRSAGRRQCLPATSRRACLSRRRIRRLAVTGAPATLALFRLTSQCS